MISTTVVGGVLVGGLDWMVIEELLGATTMHDKACLGFTSGGHSVSETRLFSLRHR
jgi:hypothetical protein